MTLTTDIKNASLTDWAKDTWKKECIKEIHIFGRVPFFSEEWKWSCSIKLQNGNTTSKQEIENTDLKLLLSEVELFLSTLK